MGATRYPAYEIAQYFIGRHMAECGEVIDATKLFRLLYFAQREHYITFSRPLFADVIYVWGTEPVLLEVREDFHNHNFSNGIPAFDKPLTDMLNTVTENFSDAIPVGLHTSYDENTNYDINDTQADAEEEKRRRKQKASTTGSFSR